MTTEKIYATYIGAGNYVAGVPARDMTEADWNALPQTKQKEALAAGTHKLNKGGKSAEVTDGSSIS